MDCNDCSAMCDVPLTYKLMQQTEDFCSCNDRKVKRKKKNCKKTKKESKCKAPLDCNEDFTPSGWKPEKTAGPFGNDYIDCSKFAPHGCWSTCKKKDNEKRCFEGVPTTSHRAPFGPYGPWNCNGPLQFKIMRSKYIRQAFPLSRTKARLNGLGCTVDEPMGKMRPWPLSGSCRYAGRPYGPCRPLHGAYKSRGPFGIWAMAGNTSDFIGRPDTPAQLCWRPAKPGYRPCTPCHRPLFRPCKDKCISNAKCDYVAMGKINRKCEEEPCDKF